MASEQRPVQTSAAGLLHCLRFLADEAASLNLHQTFSAIEQALLLAARESMSPDPAAPPLH